MSQHYFTSTHQDHLITVILGWDRPLSHFFLVVECNDSQADSQDDETEEDEGILYSNLNDPDAWGKPLAYYRGKLTELGIAVPESMFTETLLDETHCVGNRYVWHEADGTFKETC